LRDRRDARDDVVSVAAREWMRFFRSRPPAAGTTTDITDPADAQRRFGVPPPPDLPALESPTPEDVLSGLPSKEQVIENAPSADEIVSGQPTVDQLLGRG
jgi:hypothetical protein